MKNIEHLQIEEFEKNHKRLNNINTFACNEGELCLSGTDEEGEDLTIWFDAYDFLSWIDKETIEYIKEDIIKEIKKI